MNANRYKVLVDDVILSENVTRLRTCNINEINDLAAKQLTTSHEWLSRNSEHLMITRC